MLIDKLKLQETAEKMGLNNCAEAFAALRIQNGNRWAAIMLDQVKEKRRVFPTLTDMYNCYSCNYNSHGSWPLMSYSQSTNTRVWFDADDILPHDGTVGFVRYTKHTVTEEGEKNEIYKMKIGKAVRNSLVYNHADLCEKALIYMTERATSEWNARQMSENDYKLKIDNDFEFIYSSEEYAAHISSCQADADNYSFYDLIKGAQAASLVNSDNKILCRAILFNEIHLRNDEDKTVRGIERMYASDNRLDYKQIFLIKLKKEGLIDIYKDFNAGAYDERAWRDVNDELYNLDMYVALKRELDYDDSVSWMDTFYMTDGKTRCCNYSFGRYEIRHSDDNVTWGDIADEGIYDEWLGENVRGYDEDDFETVYSNGRAYYVCPRTRDNDFHYCEDVEEYHYCGECYHSERDDCWYLNAVYSDYYDSYIRDDKALCCYRANGEEDYAYRDDLEELEDGEYMIAEEMEIEQNGIRYRAVEIV